MGRIIFLFLISTTDFDELEAEVQELGSRLEEIEDMELTDENLENELLARTVGTPSFRVILAP